MQFNIYPQTYIEPKYGAFYFKNEDRVQTLSLLLWLKKVLRQKKKIVLFTNKQKIFLGNLPHTNQNIPPNIHCAKILQKQIHGPNIKFDTMTSTC